MKYNVGDVVYVRRDLSFDHFGIVPNMLKYKGVRTIIKFNRGNNWYDLECDGGFYGWVDYMLEDIKEVRKKKLEKLYEV